MRIALNVAHRLSTTAHMYCQIITKITPGILLFFRSNVLGLVLYTLCATTAISYSIMPLHSKLTHLMTQAVNSFDLLKAVKIPNVNDKGQGTKITAAQFIKNNIPHISLNCVYQSMGLVNLVGLNICFKKQLESVLKLYQAPILAPYFILCIFSNFIFSLALGFLETNRGKSTKEEVVNFIDSFSKNLILIGAALPYTATLTLAYETYTKSKVECIIIAGLGQSIFNFIRYSLKPETRTFNCLIKDNAIDSCAFGLSYFMYNLLPNAPTYLQRVWNFASLPVAVPIFQSIISNAASIPLKLTVDMLSRCVASVGKGPS